MIPVVLNDFSKATAGTYIMPSDLAQRGTIATTFNSTPSSTSALPLSPTARQRICWQQPVSLYVAFGNGLSSWGNNTPEGPEPNPDPNTFYLPAHFCN